MPESQVHPPLTNDEVAAYHIQTVEARQSYDLAQQGYVNPHDEWAYSASDDYLTHRIRHTTESGQELVTVGGSGEHQLSTESLTADFGQLSKLVKQDIAALSEAIADPVAVRKAMWDNHERNPSIAGTWYPPKPRGSKEPLTLEEAKIYLEDREPVVPGNEEEALRIVSLRTTAALLDRWKQKAYGRADPPKDSEVELRLDYEYAGPTDLRKHLESGQVRENVEQRFRSAHRERLGRLGRAAVDASGVRSELEEHTVGQEEGSTSAPKSRAERIQELEQEERGRILRDPDEVRKVLAQTRSQFLAREYEPAQQNYETDQSEANRRLFEQAETRMTRIRNLYRFISRWQRADTGEDFGTYMTGQAEEQQAELERYAELGGKLPDDVNRRMDEFDLAYKAYDSREGYSFTGTLKHKVYQHSVQRVNAEMA